MSPLADSVPPRDADPSVALRQFPVSIEPDLTRAPTLPPARPSEVSPFPAIGDYALLSDCETTALVAPSGNIEWLCLPRMDSPSVFGSLLDRDAGGFRLGPADLTVPDARRYLPGTMILETSWGTKTGWVVVRDVLLIGPWDEEREIADAVYSRAPTDYAAEHVLLRTVRCLNGEVQMHLDCDPLLDYGRRPVRWEYTDRGQHDGRAFADGTDLDLRLSTNFRIGFEGSRAIARSLLKEGDERYCALSWSNTDPPLDVDDASRRLAWTAHHWQHWLSRGEFPDHPWRSYLQRSALTVKALTYAPTGALVAAPTTSLPETPGGERNWDYRFTWIRDSAFALWALYSLGFDWEANDFFRFLADVAERDPELQVVYGIGGESDLTEQILDHLQGYEGARPVRTGNGAHSQRQHDVWGVVLDAVYIHTRSRDHFDERTWPLLQRQVEAALAHWREPDCGIWEVRGELRHFTSSKVMCWVAIDRGARLARIREAHELADCWENAAAEIEKDICAHGLDDRGAFTQSYGSGTLDASLLLLPLVRFLPPDDPRIRATVMAIAEELTEDGLVLRYRTETTDDGLNGVEGSFTICSFWLVSALVEIGELTKARRLCEKLLSLASPLGLYAEEIDPRSGRHLGNFPQAFSHLALINAVIHVIQAEQPDAPHPFARLIA
jgi:GH15 family glucan-1,4-alpha-glucosidase